MARKSPSPLYGSDMLASRIAACLYSANPIATKKSRASANNDINIATTAAKSTTDARRSASHSVKSNFSERVNSQFKLSGGKKRKATASSSSSADADSSRRKSRRSNTTLSAQLPSSAIASTPVPHYNAGYVDTESLAPTHRPIKQSVHSSNYKRLTPRQIVRLSPSDEIIIIIPPTKSDTIAPVKAGIEYMNSVVNAVISKTCVGGNAAERKDELKRYRTRHELPRDGAVAHQFCVRIKSYGERHRFMDVNTETGESTMTESDISGMWNDIGLNVELCGYARSKLALLKMRYIGYLEVYQLACDGSVLNNQLSFAAGDLDEQLVNHLWSVNGCSVSSIEVMMKYYNALATRQKKTIQNMKSRNKVSLDAANAAAVATEAAQSQEQRHAFAELVKTELSEKNLYLFASKVDAKYKERFARQYSTYTKFSDFILPGDTVVTLYEEFKSSFPCTHTTLARIVSTKSHLVDLADPMKAFFGEDDKMPSTSFDDTLDDSGPDDEPNETRPNETRRLNQLERCLLEYFLSLIRLHSKKQLRWWSQMTPLGYYSRGFKQPGQKSHLNAASCTLRTAWRHLDELSKKCEPIRKNVIQNQLTQSCVMDNWQVSVTKLFQDAGKSSVQQKGTAYMTKKDKALVLPPKTIISSPLGIRFSVDYVESIDVHSTRVFASIVAGQEIDDDTSRAQVRNVKDHGFLWPAIHWDVVLIPGLDQCRAVTYIDQYIPAPLGARVRQMVSSDDLIFQPRVFPAHNDEDSRIFETDEYHACLVRCTRLVHLNSFGIRLQREHSIEDDLIQQQQEAEEMGIVLENQQSNVDSEMRKLVRCKEETLISSLGKCTSAMKNVLTFHSDVTRQVNPSANKVDSFYCFPIYPRDETTREGMTLVSTKVNESVGLIDEVNGDYVEHENTKKRFVFMHGDALSVVNHVNVRPRIARRATHIGNEKHVKPLLNAFDSTFMQKGHFHQLMHQSAVIYSLYYGAFLQPLQVACAVKRVNGDPVKGKFQDHERWLIKVHIAAVRHLQRSWMTSCSREFLAIRDGEEPQVFIQRLEESLNAFIDTWLDSEHEPSRVVMHFIKCMDSYLRCKRGISKNAFWDLEKESCLWIAPWKVMGKTTYLRLQCEYIEFVYGTGFASWLREVMRINNICVLTDTLKGVAFDHVNELYNYYLKIPPTTPYIETACQRSTHCMTQRLCAKEIFETTPRKQGLLGASEQDNIGVVESVLCKSDIFRSLDKVSMTDTHFWVHVTPKKNVGTTTDKSKETAQMADAELRIRERFCQPEGLPRMFDDDVDGADGNDGDDVSVAESVAGSVGSTCHRELDETEMDADTADAEDEPTVEERVQSASEALKKLGNVKKKKFNKKALEDPFVSGKKLLKDVAKIRRKAIKRQRREFQLIEMSVRYFTTQMQYRRCILKRRLEQSKSNEFAFEEREWEASYSTIMEERRSNGLANIKH